MRDGYVIQIALTKDRWLSSTALTSVFDRRARPQLPTHLIRYGAWLVLPGPPLPSRSIHIVFHNRLTPASTRRDVIQATRPLDS
jgi:hypothetical protein